MGESVGNEILSPLFVAATDFPRPHRLLWPAMCANPRPDTVCGVPALGFRPRLDRIDELLLATAQRRNAELSTLEQARGEPAIGFVELFPDEGWLPRHYGKLARSAWRLVDEVFKPADSPVDGPPGFEAKSVQVADIYEVPPAVTSRTAFLVLWAAQDEPVMVPFPEIPTALLEPDGHRLEETRQALHELVWEICERLNVVASAARGLAARHESE